jgi:hypothetical protein
VGKQYRLKCALRLDGKWIPIEQAGHHSGTKGGIPPPGPPPTPLPGPPPCSLNGEGSPCKCDTGWTGLNCGQLDLLPAPPFSKQVTPLSATTNNNAAANSTWGMSVVGPDSKGVYHGYMTEIANNCPLGDYGVASQLVHMTAFHPIGPWTRQGVALSGFAHNPQAVVAPNGTIFLFHIGAELPAHCVKNCTHQTATTSNNEDLQMQQHAGLTTGEAREAGAPSPCPHLGHGTSVAVANHYEGPWTRYSYILGSQPTNPGEQCSM